MRSAVVLGVLLRMPLPFYGNGEIMSSRTHLLDRWERIRCRCGDELELHLLADGYVAIFWEHDQAGTIQKYPVVFLWNTQPEFPRFRTC